MPDRPHPVVVDTTPIIALASIDRLDLLATVYEEIIIPPAVEAEVLARGSRAGAADLRSASWIRVRELKDPFGVLLLSDLGVGEAEVLVLAGELKARRVVIDERRARSYARYLGFPLTGTLGVLLRAKAKGLIDAIAPLIEQLRRNGIRLAPALVEQALRMAGEDQG